MSSDLVGRVPLSAPWTVAEFINWMRDELGTDVVLSAWGSVSTGHSAGCGFLYRCSDQLVIKFDARRSQRHQRQQIFHECAHALLGHVGDTNLDYLTRQGALAEGINPQTLMSVLRRGAFATAEEIAAETLGTELALRSAGAVDDRSGAQHRAATFVER